MLCLCHLFSRSQHHFLWDGTDLTVHLQHFLLLLHHTNMEHSEVCSTEIQRQEVAFLCWEEEQVEWLRVRRIKEDEDCSCFCMEASTYI